MIVENTIEKFLLEAPPEAITPTTVIFQAAQGQRLKPYEELEPAIRKGINASIAKLDGQWNSRTETIYKASHNLSYGYDSIKSLLMIGALSEQSTDKRSNSGMIEKNLNELKKKLTTKADVVLPLIRASLSGLHCEGHTYITTAEHQSVASQSRKNEQENDVQIGDKPDVMLATTSNNKKYELLFVECSRISCTLRKKSDE